MKLHLGLLMPTCLWYVFIVLAILIGHVNEATLCVANALLFMYVFIVSAILIGLVNEATLCVANAHLFMVCIYSVSNAHRSC